jgi:hypothetical protein
MPMLPETQIVCLLKALWSAKVEGKAYGIAFSGGNLFVSMGLGHIYCFRS